MIGQKTMALLAITVFRLPAAVGFAQEPAPANLVAPDGASATLPTKAEASGKAWTVKNNWVDADIRIPVVSGLPDQAWQGEFNRKIELWADRTVADYGDQAAKLESDGILRRPVPIKIDFSVTGTERVLSVIVTRFTLTGATGQDTVFPYNIDVELCRILALSDAFRNGADYRTAIDEFVRGAIEEDTEAGRKVYFHGAMGFQSIADDQGFYLENAFLVIVFPKYSIAPGYVGSPEFRIPVSSLAAILKSEYATP